jgi:hypothetical protein
MRELSPLQPTKTYMTGRKTGAIAQINLCAAFHEEPQLVQ